MNERVGRIAAIWLLSTCLGAAAQTPPRALIVKNVTVADPVRPNLLPNQTVVIRDGRILIVNDAANVSVNNSDRAQIVDGAGKYLIPGLWDMHVHVGGAGDSVLVLMAVNGVTHVRDMGGDLFAVRDLQDRIAAGALVGPTVKTAGPILEDRRWLKRARQSLPYPIEHRIPTANPFEARVAVAMAAELGVDFIKTRNVTSATSFDAIISAAKARGLVTAGHEPMTVSIAEAARLGQRSFEHLPFLSLCLPGQEATEAQIAETVKAMVDHGAYAAPTLIASWLRVSPVKELRARLEGDDPLLRYLSSDAKAAWLAQLEDQAGEEGGLDWAGMLERSLPMLQRMHRAGAPLLTGTDLSVPFVYPGFGVHTELAMMVDKLGLTPREALATATANPAALMGFSEREGGVKSGMNANLALLEANPFEDIAAVGKIHAVILRGRLLDKDELETLKDWAAANKDAKPTAPALLDRKRQACAAKPTEACAAELGRYFFVKGDYETSAGYFEKAGALAGAERGRYAEMRLDALANLVYDEQAECAVLRGPLETALAARQDDPAARMAILARALEPLSKRSCAETLAQCLPHVAQIEPSRLPPEELAAHQRFMAEYWLRVAKDPERAFSHRQATMPAGWQDDALALRELAQWCFDQNLKLPEARRFAARSAELAAAELQKGRSRLLEAAILDAMDRPAEAAAIIEKILASFSNDYLRGLHQKYQDRAAKLNR